MNDPDTGTQSLNLRDIELESCPITIPNLHNHRHFTNLVTNRIIYELLKVGDKNKNHERSRGFFYEKNLNIILLFFKLVVRSMDLYEVKYRFKCSDFDKTTLRDSEYTNNY